MRRKYEVRVQLAKKLRNKRKLVSKWLQVMRTCELTGRAVVVVGQHSMIVNEEAGQQGTSGWTAHGGRHERIREKCTTVPQNGSSFRHVIQRTKFNVLVISQEEDDVGLLGGFLSSVGVLFRRVGRFRLLLDKLLPRCLLFWPQTIL
jgi:hypothetical protein